MTWRWSRAWSDNCRTGRARGPDPKAVGPARHPGGSRSASYREGYPPAIHMAGSPCDSERLGYPPAIHRQRRPSAPSRAPQHRPAPSSAPQHPAGTYRRSTRPIRVTICARGGRFVTPRVQGIAATRGCCRSFSSSLMRVWPTQGAHLRSRAAHGLPGALAGRLRLSAPSPRPSSCGGPAWAGRRRGVRGAAATA